MTNQSETLASMTDVQRTQVRIDQLFSQFARLSDSELPPGEDYFRIFLEGVMDILQPFAAAVWRRGADGRPELLHQVNLEPTGIESPANRGHHEELLREAFQMARPLFLPPHGRADEQDGQAPLTTNATDYPVLLVPIMVERQVAGLLEIWQKEHASAESGPAPVQFLVHMAYFASLYLRNRELQRLTTEEERWKRWETFATHLHRGLGVPDVASVLASEGRTLTGCDRCTAAVRHRDRARIVGMSGPGAMEKKSKVGQRLRNFINQVDRNCQPIVWQGSTDSRWPASVQKALEEYIAASGTACLVAQPLRDNRRGRNRFAGVLLLEWLPREPVAEPPLAWVDRMTRDAATALSNACEFRGPGGRTKWTTAALETIVAICLGIAAGGLFLYGARVIAERRSGDHVAMIDQAAIADAARETAIKNKQAAEDQARDALAERDQALREQSTINEQLRSVRAEKDQLGLDGGKLRGQVAQLTHDRDEAARQLETIRRERDQMSQRQAALLQERDQALRDKLAAMDQAKGSPLDHGLTAREITVTPASRAVAADRDRLARENADLAKRLKAMTAQRDKAFDDRASALTDMRQTRLERDRTRDRVSATRAELDEAKRRYEESQSRYATLNQSYANVQTKLDQTMKDAESARLQLATKDQEAAGWKRRAEDSAQQASAALQAKLEQALKDLDGAQRALAAKGQEVAAWKRQGEDSTKQAAGALEAKLQQALKDAQNVRVELAAKSQEAADLKSRMDASAGDAAADRAHLVQVRGDLEKARSKVETLRRRLGDAEAALAASQGALLEWELNDWLAASAWTPSENQPRPDSTEPSRLPSWRGSEQSPAIKLTSQPVPASPSALDDRIPALSGGEHFAMITVLMPADAELTFEGEVMHEAKQRGEKRIFRTPRLDPAEGTEYYLVGASWTDDSGEPVHRREKVIVERGKSYRIDLRDDRGR